VTVSSLSPLGDGEGDHEVVEGLLATNPLFDVRPDPRQYAIKINADGLGRNSNNENTLFPRPRRWSLILFPLIWLHVDLPVDLDRHTGFRAVEVQHIGPDRVLSPELQTGQFATTQTYPEPRFGRR